MATASLTRTSPNHDGGEQTRRLILGRSEWGGLRLTTGSNVPGRYEGKVSPEHRILIHTGEPARIETRMDVFDIKHVAVRGDITIIPAGAEIVWHDRDPCSTSNVWFSHRLLSEAAEAMGRRPGPVDLRPRLQQRDPQFEHLCDILAEISRNAEPVDSIYIDSLATALSARLVWRFAERAPRARLPALPPKRLKLTLGYIEEHLEEDLRLATLAGVAGLSASHFRVLFRGAVGKPVHQYIIERRVARARELLEGGHASIAEAAQASGFCHQSHLARRMRQVLGMTPADLQRLS